MFVTIYTYAFEDTLNGVEKLEILLMDMNDEERFFSSEDNFSHSTEVILTGYKKLYKVSVSLYYDVEVKKFKNLDNEEYETLNKIKVYDDKRLLGEIDVREYTERVKIQSSIPGITGVSYKGNFDLSKKNEIVGKNSKFIITDYNLVFDRTINDFCIIGFYGYFLTM